MLTPANAPAAGVKPVMVGLPVVSITIEGSYIIPGLFLYSQALNSTGIIKIHHAKKIDHGAINPFAKVLCFNFSFFIIYPYTFYNETHAVTC